MLPGQLCKNHNMTMQQYFLLTIFAYIHIIPDVLSFVNHENREIEVRAVKRQCVSAFFVTVSEAEEVGNMTIEQGLRMVAGIFVLASVSLGYFVHPGWYLLTAFVGLNLLQSAFTGWCPMMWILGKAGCKP